MTLNSTLPPGTSYKYASLSILFLVYLSFLNATFYYFGYKMDTQFLCVEESREYHWNLEGKLAIIKIGVKHKSHRALTSDSNDHNKLITKTPF